MDLNPNLQLILTFLGGTVVTKLVDFMVAQFKSKQDAISSYRDEIRADLKELKTENDRIGHDLDDYKKQNLLLQAKYDKLEIDHSLLKNRYQMLLEKLKRHPDVYADLKGEFDLEIPNLWRSFFSLVVL